jgi:DNA polymerase-3 subunit delta'
MAWHSVHDHDEIVDQFRRSLARGRLASTFLFVGPEGVGKRTFARKLAQALLCERVPETRLDPCEECPGCIQVAAGSHPDLELIAKPEGRASLLVEQFIGSRENRGHEGLCYNLARKPLMGTRRVAIIDDADDLEAEGANALLKTLEEPPPRSVLILIGTSLEKQLPTIRSRCQIIRFAPLARDTVAELLLLHGLATDQAEAQRLARYSEGSLTRATDLADAALWSFRGQLLAGLARRPVDTVHLAQAVTVFVEEAGSEAAAKRGRARIVIGFAAEYFRQLVRQLSGAAAGDDEELHALVSRAARQGPLDPETAADCAQRCLDALGEIDRNANLANVIECWLDDVGQAISGGRRLVPTA